MAAEAEWRKTFKEERQKLFAHLTDKDLEEVGIKGGFKKTNMIQDDMEAYIQTVSFGNDFHVEINDEF